MWDAGVLVLVTEVDLRCDTEQFMGILVICMHGTVEYCAGNYGRVAAAFVKLSPYINFCNGNLFQGCLLLVEHLVRLLASKKMKMLIFITVEKLKPKTSFC